MKIILIICPFCQAVFKSGLSTCPVCKTPTKNWPSAPEGVEVEVKIA